MLNIENLKVEIKIDGVYTSVVDNISFQLKEGDTYGLVGESGCGKSVTSKAIMGLLNPQICKVSADKMEFDGKDLLKLRENEWRSIRGNQISMIFQNPMTYLNPLMKCGQQIKECILLHQKKNASKAKAITLKLLEDLELSDPAKVYRSFPFELSGGMKQRVMIAMALSCKPKLLIADEPTTALDVTVQAGILQLIKNLQSEYGMALIMVTHDLGVVKDMIKNLSVMYAGQIIEKGPMESIMNSPAHPYTKGLIYSIPKIDTNQPRLNIIPGRVPAPIDFPGGCRFFKRCDYGDASCQNLEYHLAEYNNHQTACQFAHKLEPEKVT